MHWAAGGLGAPLLLYLAAAGIGTIGVIDDDTVDVTNLQRQVIHDDAAVGHAMLGGGVTLEEKRGFTVDPVTGQKKLACDAWEASEYGNLANIGSTCLR